MVPGNNDNDHEDDEDYNLGRQESVIGKEGKNIMKQRSLLCRRQERETFTFETLWPKPGNCALFRKIPLY